MADTHQDALNRLELERQQLENDKLRAEVAEHTLTWWKRPGYFAGAAPILIALAGVFTAWVTGYFDTQRDQLATEISTLEKDVTLLAEDKAELEAEKVVLEATKSELETQKTALLEEKAALTADIEAARKSLDLAYLRIRLAADETKYALGHFEAYGQESSQYTEYIMQNWDSLPETLQPQMNGLFELLANRFNVMIFTKDSLEVLDERLDKIESSPWTKTLTSDPFLRQNGLLKDESGRYFDINEGRFLEAEETKSLFPGIIRPVTDD